MIRALRKPQGVTGRRVGGHGRGGEDREQGAWASGDRRSAADWGGEWEDGRGLASTAFHTSALSSRAHRAGAWEAPEDMLRSSG